MRREALTAGFSFRFTLASSGNRHRGPIQGFTRRCLAAFDTIALGGVDVIQMPPVRISRITAANAAVADPWADAQIKPVPVDKTWRNDRDPTRRRATFDVPYPLLEITIENAGDLHTRLLRRFERTRRRSVPGVRLVLLALNLFFSATDFRECQFHRRGAQGESRVLGSAFKDCHFERCMLGGTLFDRVTFEGSTFLRCDFGASQFTECQFINCMFIECTAENASFVATEIDPTAFLNGMPPPVYNYETPVHDGEQTRDQVVADWVEARRKIAAQLLRSNTDIHNSVNSDRGLYELKRAELEARVKTLRAQSLKEGVLSLLLRALRVCGEWLVLNATKGGTSLSRLFLTPMFFVPSYALLLSTSHVTFMNQDCHLNSFQPSLVLQQLARATSLFLAFGYTAFSGGALATVLLTAAASLGLLWYALVAEVVIHRVYR